MKNNITHCEKCAGMRGLCISDDCICHKPVEVEITGIYEPLKAGIKPLSAKDLVGQLKDHKPVEESWNVELAEEGTPLAIFQKERTNAISEMFDNKYQGGIYPTSKFFARLDKCVSSQIAFAEKRGAERAIEELRTKLLENPRAEVEGNQVWNAVTNQILKESKQIIK